MTAGGTAGAVTAAAGSAAAQDGGNNTTGGGNATGGNATGGNETGGGNATGGNETGGGNESGGGGGGGGSGPIDYGGWLDDANGWSEGGTQDARGESEVTVQVGAGEGGLAFEPVAVHVDEGATIIWEWTGEGGSHNVAAQEGGDFSSDIQSSGTFEWTAEGGPIVTYQCDPHAGQGMKGAIAIGEDVPRASAAAAAAEPADPHEMGVPFQPHFVGIATIMMMISSLIFTFYLLKYGESPNTKGGN